MLVGRVAVAPTVGGEAVVRGAEVGGGDDDGGARNAPAHVIDAAEHEARAADLAALEQRLAQPHRCHAVAGLHQISVAAGAADGVAGVRSGVVGGACGLPVVDGE